MSLLPTVSARGEDLCEFFMYCPGSSERSSGKSLPSAIISGALNPSSLSKVKGVGIETLLQPQNPVAINLVTGTGKVGGMLSSLTENSFFGNRTIELDEVTLQRHLDNKRYKSKKIHLAGGVSLFQRRNISLDAGISLKRHPDIKKVNPGAGLSGKLWNFTVGYNVFRDDSQIIFGQSIDSTSGLPFSILYNSDIYQETFTVTALTVGTKIGNLFFDYGLMKTKYKFYADKTVINLYSASYNIKRFLINAGYRHEASPNKKFIDGVMVEQRELNDVYMGVQYSLNRNILLGVAYNNFLLRDLSGTFTLSF